MSGTFEDLTGQVFGRLTVRTRIGPDKNGHMRWRCECVCGEMRVCIGSNLKRGTVSCGCLSRELVTARKTTHGMAYSPEYAAWNQAIQRCHTKRSRSYAGYGGRGITVCDRWRGQGGFSRFLEDMGPRPSGFSLERKQNNLGYYKENCEWATRKAQANNRRSNHLITYDGRTQTLTQWAEEIGISPHALAMRLNSDAWTHERAFTTPVQPHARAHG